MTLFHCDYLLKGPRFNCGYLGVRASSYGFGGGHSHSSRWLLLRKMNFNHCILIPFMFHHNLLIITPPHFSLLDIEDFLKAVIKCLQTVIKSEEMKRLLTQVLDRILAEIRLPR